MLRASVLILALSVAPAYADVPRILVLGDSLSAGYGVALDEGWVNLLRARLVESGYEYEVVNASISGDTTQGGASRLPRALTVHEPEVVIIELGGNDGLRGIPTAVMRDNLERMAGAAQEAGARVLLVGVEIPANYGPSYRDAFRSAFVEVARATGAGLVEHFMDGVAMDETLMQADGIHPNAAGQPVLLDNLWPELQRVLDELGEGTP